MSPELHKIVDAIIDQGFKIASPDGGALCVLDHDGSMVGAFTAASDWRNVLAVMQGRGLIWSPGASANLAVGGRA